VKKIIPVALTLLLSGCFDYSSVMKIEQDGSGTLELEIKLLSSESENVSFEDYQGELDSVSGLTIDTFVVDTIDTVLRLLVRGRFDNFEAVTADFFGADSFSITEKEKAQVHRFKLYKRFEPSDQSIDFSSMDFDPYAFKWHEELILPGKIAKHNADAQRGDTLIWERRTWDVYEKGLIMEAMWEVQQSSSSQE